MPVLTNPILARHTCSREGSEGKVCGPKPCPSSSRRRAGALSDPSCYRGPRLPANLNLVTIFFLLFLTSCATLYGWKIHAPGVLSQEFSQKIKPRNERIGLYLSPSLLIHESKEKGGALADPQVYYIGEALAPMLVEAFQAAFSEPIMLETEPTPEIMKRYGIPRIATVRIKEFYNRVTLKGQTLTLVTETSVLDKNLLPLALYESRGVSDAQKVFSKKGGPEVNLNEAIESNVLATVQQLQDWGL